MKILKHPKKWTERVECDKCGAELEIEPQDLYKGKFPESPHALASDYIMAEYKFYVKCPIVGCNNSIFVDNVPEHLKHVAVIKPKNPDHGN